MSEKEAIQKSKVIIAGKCLDTLPRILRNIIVTYLQYEESVRMKHFLRAEIPTKPFLTVERMARDKIYHCEEQPFSETIYIPFIPRWILTIQMVTAIMKSGIVKQIIWECPGCREWKELLAYFKSGPQLIGYEIDFVKDSICHSACLLDAQELKERHLEIAFEDGKKPPKINITQKNFAFEQHEADSCLNNTYPTRNLISRLNSNGHENIQSFWMDHLRDKDYFEDAKIKLKRELARVGAPVLTKISFSSRTGHREFVSENGQPIDTDKVMNEMFKILTGQDP
jgi:hypothetical protein